jgi:hypothetical protein
LKVFDQKRLARPADPPNQTLLIRRDVETEILLAVAILHPNQCPVVIILEDA